MWHPLTPTAPATPTLPPQPSAVFRLLFSTEPLSLFYCYLSIRCQFQVCVSTFCSHSPLFRLRTCSQCPQPLTPHPTPSPHSTPKSFCFGLVWFLLCDQLTESNLGHSRVLGCGTALWSRTYSLRTKTASPQQSSTG